MYKQITLDNGNTLRIHQTDSDYTDCPRDWDGNLAIFTTRHHGYNIHSEGWEIPANVTDLNEYAETLRKEHDAAIILPLYMYDHSGVRFSTESFVGRAAHAQWDSGIVGFVFAKRGDILEAWGCKRLSKKLLAQVEEQLKGVVELYDQWQRGDMYRFEILTPTGEHEDSCGGFYGQDFANNGLSYHVGGLSESELERFEAAQWKEPQYMAVYV